MKFIIYVGCLSSVLSVGTLMEPQPIQDATHQEDTKLPLQIPTKMNSSLVTPTAARPKLEFPSTEIDVSTPILVGDDPKKSNLPPKVFPIKQEKESAGPVIISSVDVGKTNFSKEHTMNSTNEKLPENVHIKQPDEALTTGTQPGDKDKKQETAEQEDMLHSKYKGGQDVDELRPVKKASEKEEKKTPKKDPNSEVSVSPTMDKSGPKLMNETKTKSGETMLESTSKMMAVSSSVLANTQPKQHGIIESGKTMVSLLITAVALISLGVLGLLIWKRIAMRRFGRDVLINEDDFDEVADMHTFDRAQIQIT